MSELVGVGVGKEKEKEIFDAAHRAQIFVHVDEDVQVQDVGKMVDAVIEAVSTASGGKRFLSIEAWEASRPRAAGGRA